MTKQLTARQAAALDLLNWYPEGRIRYRDRWELSPPQEYALYRQLVSNVVRFRRKYLFFIKELTGRPLEKLDSEVIVCLMIGLTQLDLLSGVQSYAAVNESVNLISFLKKPRLKGFINGNLRSFQRNRSELETALNRQSLAVRTSHPDWMVKRWKAQFGSKTTAEICNQNNQHPQVSIVLNPGFDQKAIRNDLRGQFELIDQHEKGFTVTDPAGLFDTKWMKSGALLIQDYASQQINNLVETLPRNSVLDACASPGGKLFHLEWQFKDIETLVGAEKSKERMKRLLANRDRYRSRAQIIRMDATRPGFSSRFNLVLVDAPCSATGTIRKHPELKWQRQQADILRNSQKQLEILNGIKEVVKLKGHILYITCSLEAEENRAVIHQFLQENSDTFAGIPFPSGLIGKSTITNEGFFQCLPQEGAMGLFAALLQRTAG